MDSSLPNVDRLRQFYEQSPAAKAFFEHAARRERDQATLTLKSKEKLEVLDLRKSPRTQPLVLK